MLRTSFCDLVGCDVPLQLAPMGGVGTPELAAAVTNAGGMGMLAAGPMPPPAVAAFLDATAKLTDGPFGMNFLIPFLEPEGVEIAASKARLVDFYHGPVDPELVRIVHAGGALAGWQVGSVEDAKAAVDAGCDMLVVRGVEGGGRMWGRHSLWPLLVQVLDAVDVPVLAAGGLATSRDLAAVLAAGAAGARMGTRFLAAEEASLHPVYRQALIGAGPDDTVLTDSFSVGWPQGPKPCRVLRSSLDAAEALPEGEIGSVSLAGQEMPVERLSAMMPIASAQGHVEAMAMYAGMSVHAVREVEPAADIVRSIVDGADRLLAR